jgi:hypothetical protein
MTMGFLARSDPASMVIVPLAPGIFFVGARASAILAGLLELAAGVIASASAHPS